MVELGAELPTGYRHEFAGVCAQPSQPLCVKWMAGPDDITAEICQATGGRSLITSVGFSQEIEPDIASFRVFDTIRHWIRECDGTHNHGPCRETRAPRRLLDIGPDLVPVPSAKGIHLVQNVQGEVKYIALSHC
ncbi:hypothetical protein F5X98DRAFT_235563 [Xylaria grammica]|nr:hypothetical protein F5X98DRAFT_235563 [Xylaria grammica]